MVPLKRNRTVQRSAFGEVFSTWNYVNDCIFRTFQTSSLARNYNHFEISYALFGIAPLGYERETIQIFKQGGYFCLVYVFIRLIDFIKLVC